MKRFFYSFMIAAISLTSCISSKKYSNLVNEKLRNDSEINTATNYDNWLVINTDSSNQNGNSVKQLERSFIPAIIYWGWNSTVECEISPIITTNYLKESIYKAADSLSLSKKLNGNKLVINLNRIPGRFVYQSKGNVVYLFFAYTVNGVEAISPASMALVADYKIQKSDGSISEGDVVIQNNDNPVNNIWKTTKKFTWAYLDLYHEDTERMGTELVKEIIQKLDNNLINDNNELTSHH